MTIARNIVEQWLARRFPPPAEPYPGFNKNAIAKLKAWAEDERADGNEAAAQSLELAAIRLEGFPG